MEPSPERIPPRSTDLLRTLQDGLPSLWLLLDSARMFDSAFLRHRSCRSFVDQRRYVRNVKRPTMNFLPSLPRTSIFVLDASFVISSSPHRSTRRLRTDISDVKMSTSRGSSPRSWISKYGHSHFLNSILNESDTRLDLEWGGNAECLDSFVCFLCVFFGACYSRQRMGLKCLMPTMCSKSSLKLFKCVLFCVFVFYERILTN